MIGIGVMTFLIVGKDGDTQYAPYAELLGKPCWINEGGDYSKFRVVAVSHKGAVAIRRWDDTSGRGAKWFRAKDVRKGRIRFDEKDI